MKAFMSSHHPGRFVGACGLIGLPLQPALSIAEARGAVKEAERILAESEPVWDACIGNGRTALYWTTWDEARLYAEFPGSEDAVAYINQGDAALAESLAAFIERS